MLNVDGWTDGRTDERTYVRTDERTETCTPMSSCKSRCDKNTGSLIFCMVLHIKIQVPSSSGSLDTVDT